MVPGGGADQGDMSTVTSHISSPYHTDPVKVIASPVVTHIRYPILR